MIKILLKTAVLVFIILSVYFIVNPSACSNFMMGRVTYPEDAQPDAQFQEQEHGEMFVPTGDRPLAEPYSTPATHTQEEEPGDPVTGVTDTNSLAQEHEHEPMYSQEEIDYAIASRYVELENEYTRQNKMGKNTAKEISYIVMDDFELTPQEWEAFLERATASNLFNKVRTEAAEQK